MKLFLTYDYELFFGNPTGTAENCIIKPTNLIREIANKTGVKMIFFIDTGYLKQLEAFKNEFPKVEKEYQLIKAQIQTLINEGHDCQLHIHPHWEDTIHNGENWKMNVSRYKLADFSDLEIERIVVEYKDILKRWTGKEIHSYRAGGWCLQPFDRIHPAFSKANLKIDSTVFPGGKFTAGNYYYDFTEVPAKSIWKFEHDLCKENKNGSFWEYPISNYKYQPLFFWRLFLLGRLLPKSHKSIGDGYPMSSPGLRKKMLTKGMNLSASVDGYFVTKLQHILNKNEAKKFNEMLIIGHPKACTPYSLKKLEQFILNNINKHQFLTFSDVINDQ